MIFWSFISFAIALAAGLFGFGGSNGGPAGMAQILFFVFLGISIALVAVRIARDSMEEPSTHSD